jgi:hypothetical protein
VVIGPRYHRIAIQTRDAGDEVGLYGMSCLGGRTGRDISWSTIGEHLTPLRVAESGSISKILLQHGAQKPRPNGPAARPHVFQKPEARCKAGAAVPRFLNRT